MQSICAPWSTPRPRIRQIARLVVRSARITIPFARQEGFFFSCGEEEGRVLRSWQVGPGPSPCPMDGGGFRDLFFFFFSRLSMPTRPVATPSSRQASRVGERVPCCMARFPRVIIALMCLANSTSSVWRFAAIMPRPSIVLV